MCAKTAFLNPKLLAILLIMGKKTTWFILINPQSGGGQGRKVWLEVQKTLKFAQIDYQYQFSSYMGELVSLAAKAVRDGYTHLVAMGGDGTINEVINGICQANENQNEEITLAVIPVGTGNDFIRTHQIPNNAKKAALLLQQGQSKSHDVGLVSYHNPKTNQQEQRYFINVAGLAYDAYVTHASMKKNLFMPRALHYYYLIMSCVMTYKSQRAIIEYDGEKVEDTIFSIAVGNCRYNGGGGIFVPQAVPDDGLLGLTIIRQVSVWDVISNSKHFYNGNISRHPQVSLHQAKSIHIQHVDTPIWLETDGEFLGQTPVTFSILPNAIKVIVPL